MPVIIYVCLLAQREGWGVWQTCFLDRKVVIVASSRNVAFSYEKKIIAQKSEEISKL